MPARPRPDVRSVTALRERARVAGRAADLHLPLQSVAEQVHPISVRAAGALTDVAAFTSATTLAKLLHSVENGYDRLGSSLLRARIFEALEAWMGGPAVAPVPPGDDDVLRAELAAGLAAWIVELQPDALGARPAWSMPRVAIDLQMPALIYEEPDAYDGAHWQHGTTLLVRLDAWREELAFHRDAGTKPAQRLRAAQHFHDLVIEPLGPERQALATALAPRWERALASLARRAHPDQDGPAREQIISWRISPLQHGYEVHPFLHLRSKSGAFTKGIRTTPRKVLDSVAALPADRAAAEAIGFVYAASRKATPDVVQHLVGHPRVFFTDDVDRPLAVRVVDASLVVAQEADGFVLQPGTDGRALDAVELNDALRDGFTFGVDPARGVATMTTIPGDMDEVVQAAAHRPIHVPAKDAGALLTRLQGLEQHVPVTLPDGLRGTEIQADPRVVVRVTPLPGGSLRIAVGARPLRGGPFFPAGEGPARVGGVVDGARAYVVRDVPGERARAEALIERLPLDAAGVEAPSRYAIGGIDDALDFVAGLQACAQDASLGVAVEWPDGARIDVARPLGAASLKVYVRAQQDWFGLEGSATVDGHALHLALLLEAAREGRRYVALSPDRFVALSDALKHQLQTLSDVVFDARAGMEVHPEGAAALAALQSAGAEDVADDAFKALTARMEAAQQVDDTPPRALQATLRPYQREGYAFLKRLSVWGVGGCLADDMGLGKTLQALAILVDRRDRGKALVVAPTSVCFNWEREAERFAPTLRIVPYIGARRADAVASLGDGDVVVVSYAILQRDAELLSTVRFATLVLDEAQSVKNADTARAKAARMLDAEWRVALTGTPIENHVGELWSIFRVVCPGLLGSFEQFKERFAIPIDRHRDATRRKALARTVRPFLLRRTKADVLPELPARTEVVLRVPLSADERKLYDATRAALVQKMEERAISQQQGDRRFEVLAAITRLRLLSSHPKLFDESSSLPSSKLAAFLDLVDELRENGHRALVFSQFTKHLALVQSALIERDVPYQYLDGSTPAAVRRERVDAFQRGEGDLFLISLKAGGTGLNLTGADYVVHLDPWWNPAVEDQASDRAHRIGQTKPVTVYRLVAAGTIEETMLALHADKRDLVDSVLQGSDAAAKLSVDELVALIGETTRRGHAAPA